METIIDTPEKRQNHEVRNAPLPDSIREARQARQRRKKRRILAIRILLAAAVLAGLVLIVQIGSAVKRYRAEEAAHGAQTVTVFGRKGAAGKNLYVSDVEGYEIDLQEDRIQAYGNQKKYIAIHYLGVPYDGHAINADGTGAHFYIYADGTIWQSASLNAVPWQVGTAGCYKKLHEDAGNGNTIGIELCPRCDGDASNEKDPEWYFTEETQEACVKLVRALMEECGIPEENVLRHGDIVNKWCPAPYFNNNSYKTTWTWEEFKENVHTLEKTEIPEYPFVTEGAWE